MSPSPTPPDGRHENERRVDEKEVHPCNPERPVGDEREPDPSYRHQVIGKDE